MAENWKETTDYYVTDLKNKAIQCEFGDLRESLIRDTIVCGSYNESYRARLLCESDLPLAKIVDICRTTEVSEKTIEVVTQKNQWFL